MYILITNRRRQVTCMFICIALILAAKASCRTRFWTIKNSLALQRVVPLWWTVWMGMFHHVDKVIHDIKCLCSVASILTGPGGLVAGDRLIVMLPKIPEWWIVALGAWRAGKWRRRWWPNGDLWHLGHDDCVNYASKIRAVPRACYHCSPTESLQNPGEF